MYDERYQAPESRPRSYQAPERKPARTDAPIARTHLDAARRPVRMLFGAVFVAYCAISTIVGLRGDLAPLAWSQQAIVGPLTVGLALGLALAFAIFIGEVLLAEGALIWYLPLLALDAWYTVRWSDWIGVLIHAHVQSEPLIEDGIAFVVTWAAAIAVAYFGERLIFGKRRRKTNG
jgi:hypothetical protein